MTPIRSLRNQYLGVNAHLHSLWQNEGGWNHFHTRHMGDMAGMLRLALLRMGYTAVIEDSLQTRHTGSEPHMLHASVVVSDLDPQRAHLPSNHPQTTHTVAELVEAHKEGDGLFRAVAIYARESRGEPIVWIELLSPENKSPHPDSQTYLAKRQALLESGLVYLELDYLHQSPPTLRNVLDYSQQDGQLAGAHPYRIVTLDPRPDLEHGPAHLDEFDVDNLIPIIDIPLTDGNMLPFDFCACYQKTYEEMAYGLELVDYSQLPIHFESYSEADRTRIVARMLAVLEAAKHGDDLEQGPFPEPELPLNEALARLAALAGE